MRQYLFTLDSINISWLVQIFALVKQYLNSENDRSRTLNIILF